MERGGGNDEAERSWSFVSRGNVANLKKHRQRKITFRRRHVLSMPKVLILKDYIKTEASRRPEIDFKQLNQARNKKVNETIYGTGRIRLISVHQIQTRLLGILPNKAMCLSLSISVEINGLRSRSIPLKSTYKTLIVARLRGSSKSCHPQRARVKSQHALVHRRVARVSLNKPSRQFVKGDQPAANTFSMHAWLLWLYQNKFCLSWNYVMSIFMHACTHTHLHVRT